MNGPWSQAIHELKEYIYKIFLDFDLALSRTNEEPMNYLIPLNILSLNQEIFHENQFVLLQIDEIINISVSKHALETNAKQKLTNIQQKLTQNPIEIIKLPGSNEEESELLHSFGKTNKLLLTDGFSHVII